MEKTGIPLPLMHIPFEREKYLRVDLSVSNADLGASIRDPEACQAYLDAQLRQHGAGIAYGGYLEQRALYTAFTHFRDTLSEDRNIHLGVDFWAAAGSPVRVPLDGRVHSWANRQNAGDYGPVIIMEHHFGSGKMYTLYGHLSPTDLQGLYQGQYFQQGQVLAHLGDVEVNGGYAPHLHFQLIREPGSYSGDYPGVCSASSLDFYRENCPDPLSFLNYQ
jgi:murein DD-endopeptidase MepM/ murein hydrolase activator NlpD